MAIVDPWGAGDIKIDEKLLKEFGITSFSKELIKKHDHYLFQRGIVTAHRDFKKIQDRIDAKKPFIQITGIASSGPLHLGHKVDIDLFMYFSQFGKSYFAICDIDGYVSRPDEKVSSMHDAKKIAIKNLAHILALGVKQNQVYVQSQMSPAYYELVLSLSKKITENNFRAIYGHLNPGKLAANLLQYADILHRQLPEFDGKMPSLTGIGIEQDPHARATRDLSRKLSFPVETPSFIYFEHQRGLQVGKKMSASQPDTAIFLDDSPADVKKKVNRAFSGGKDTLEEHRKYGADVDIDRAFEILKFHHPDTDIVNEIRAKYSSGEMLTGELKKIVIDFLNEFLAKHQEKVKKMLPIATKMVLKQ